MKNKKGFTLIELLAVIVILAIILLIAVPSVLGVIKKAREGADTSSAKMILVGAKNYSALQEIEGTILNSTVSCSTMDIDAKAPSAETVADWAVDVKTDCSATFVDGDVTAITYGTKFSDPTTIDSVY